LFRQTDRLIRPIRRLSNRQPVKGKYRTLRILSGALVTGNYVFVPNRRSRRAPASLRLVANARFGCELQSGDFLFGRHADRVPRFANQKLLPRMQRQRFPGKLIHAQAHRCGSVKNDITFSLLERMKAMDRRRFLNSSIAGFTAAAAFSGLSQPGGVPAAEPAADSLQGRLYKTLKIGMVKVEGTLVDKFRTAKAAGFAGIELNSPSINVEEARLAVAEAGLVIDGTVCSSHWQIRHTDPSAETRAQALEDLKTALRETHAVGGHTTLLVVGQGQDGTREEVWARSIDNIAKAIPLAAELGVVIAIENVWNHFLYDHAGGADQTAEAFVNYVDQLNSPWVGMQFDIGNHWKYGDTGDWIRALGKRIVKLDVKGYSRKQDAFTKIGEGDIDWPDVRKALREINFYGWCAAEVSGGGLEHLREVSDHMDRVFGLK
jgi:hexulose-6-phosphate isomerase